MKWKSLALAACGALSAAFLTSQCSSGSGVGMAGAPLRNTVSPRLPNNIPSGAQTSYTKINSQAPVIAMTFDDGPHPSLTPRLLRVLKERNIKATFYVVGNRCGEFASVMRGIAADGHEFGNHTWTHPKSPGRWAKGALKAELDKTHDAIVRFGGMAPKTYRPPGGSVSNDQKQWIFDDYGYPTILWAVDPNDWRDRNAALVTNRILASTRPGSIVLAHDIHKTTIDAMPATLDGLLSRGYRFVTVSQLIAIGEGKIADAGGTEAPAAAPARMLSFSFSPGTF